MRTKAVMAIAVDPSFPYSAGVLPFPPKGLSEQVMAESKRIVTQCRMRKYSPIRGYNTSCPNLLNDTFMRIYAQHSGLTDITEFSHTCR